MVRRADHTPVRAIKPSSLTRREREVAELVSAGLTNREIAAKLVLSERTVEGHVAQICGKLGVRSRTQIATWVVERDAPLPTPAPAPGPTVRRRPRARTLVALAVACLLGVGAVTGLAIGFQSPVVSPLVISTVLTGLGQPGGIASNPGRDVVYVADTGNDRILMLGSDGTTRSLAISGLNGPTGLAVDAAGRLYIADTGNHRILRFNEYFVAVLAGDGTPGFSGDDGPATAAQLDSPQAVAIDAAGDVYIADTANDRVRVVDAKTGLISTVAGGGQADPFTQDYLGLYALTLRLHHPEGIAVDNAGDLFIADTRAQAIYEVTRAAQGSFGPVRRLAGTGARGYSGDGGPATAAQISDPRQMAFDGQGGLYFADSGNNRIRHIDRQGTIDNVAGTGALGMTGDNSPAISAQIALPSAVSTDVTGSLYLADTGNGRARLVRAAAAVPVEKTVAPPSFPADSYMARIQARGRLVAVVRGGTGVAFPFFAYRNPQTDQLEGFDIDMIKAVARSIFGRDDADVIELKPAQQQPVVQNERLSTLGQGDADIADATWINDANLKQVDLADPYIRTVDLLLVKKGSGITSFADTAGKRVCIATISALPLRAEITQAQPHLADLQDGSPTACLEMLHAGSTDVIYGHSPDALAIAAADPGVTFTTALLAPRMWGWGVPKGHPEFVQFLNRLVAELQTDGRWHASAARWLNGYDDVFDPTIR